MAALRRWKSYFTVLRSNSGILVSCQKPAAQNLRKWTNVLYTSVASFTVGATLCAVPFRQQVENLSHDSLIKRAASLVTDSSSVFLSQTTLALIDAFVKYSKAVHTLIALHRRYLDSLGKLTPAEEDMVWQVIIDQRAQIHDRQEECDRFGLTFASAVKLCEMAAEAAYTSGADQAYIKVQNNIELSQSQVEESRKLAEDADKQLAQSKVMEVERMTQYAASLENNEEEEVPEAYLRED